MKKYIIAGIMAAALLVSGCGEFVRDELINMQNEIDRLSTEVDKLLNSDLEALKLTIGELANGGFIIEHNEEMVGDTTVYTLVFGYLDENYAAVKDESKTITLRSGIDGKDGKDAQPFVLTAKQDTTETPARWYWFDTQADDWYTQDVDGDGVGDRFLVDGVDGKTPLLKVGEDGFWCISWDGGETWETTEWKAKGNDAKEVFTNVEIFEDRVDLTLAADSSVLSIPRYLPVELSLTRNGREVGDVLPVSPSETVSIAYTLSGTGAKKAVLVAGTDGRYKTSIKRESDTTGVVKVICPAVLPEGGYIYITVNDGNGRSTVKVISFEEQRFKMVSGDLEVEVDAAEGSGIMAVFDTNLELAAVCLFPEGTEPWMTAQIEPSESGNELALKCSVTANTAEEARVAYIVVTPAGQPDDELALFKVTQFGTGDITITGTTE